MQFGSRSFLSIFISRSKDPYRDTLKTQLIGDIIVDPKMEKDKSRMIRAKETNRNLLSSKNSSITDKIRMCLDPLMNKDFGCFSPNNTRSLSCFKEVFPSVMECLYYDRISGTYCISNTPEVSFPCDGDCDKTRLETQKLYGCAASKGAVTTCDVTEEGWCECPDDKKWNDKEDKCDCPPDYVDRGNCCTPPTIVCKNEKSEYYDCDEEECKCRPGFKRLNNEPSEECIKTCSLSTQNNPQNYSDPILGASGCGEPYYEGGFYLGTEEDYCCDGLGGCIADNGERDGSGSYPLVGKDQCLLTNGVWKLTDLNVCPREGHCDYTACETDFTLIGDKLWASECELKCSNIGCENACTSFAVGHGGMVNYECDNEGSIPTCICETNTN